MSNQNTGSIGGLEIDFDSTNSRVKGWVTNSGTVPVLEDVSLAKEAMATSERIARDHDATRISLRALARRGLRIPYEEARISVNPGTDLVYLGRNDGRRMHPRKVTDEEDRILLEMISGLVVSSDPIQRVPEYEIEILRSFSNQDIDGIAEIFRLAYDRDKRLVMWYEPTRENIRAVMENSVVAVARDKNRIISLSVAEQATLPTSIGELELYEVSDLATREEYRRRGVQQACTYLAMKEILSNHPDIIYSESRACNIGATKSLLRVGFKYAGFLPQHVQIGGPRDIDDVKGDLEDFNVLYFPLRR